MRTKTLTSIVTSTLLLSVATGCSLIKVNGKPLGGGENNSSSSSPSESPTSDDHWETSEEVAARQQRATDEARRKDDLARGKTPAWCKEYSFSDYQNVEAARFNDLLDPKHDLFVAAYMFGEVMCAIRGNLDERPKVMEIRAKWMKLHGLDELDFETAVGLRKNQTWGSQDWTTLGPAVAQMKYVTPLKLDQLGAKASMLGAFEWVRGCMGGQKEGNLGHPLSKILCVVEPLDVAKADAEIEAAPKINQESRFNLRQLVREVAAEQARFKTALTALAKEEPAVTKIIAIAEQERREWTQPSTARAKLIALIEKMEDATASNKRSAFTGCQAPTYAAWADVVRASNIPTVTTEHARANMRIAVFTTAESYLSHQALALCVAGLESDGSALGGSAPSVVRRNWRTSTIAAWFAASGDIKFDSRDLTMGTVIGNVGRESGYSDDAASGTIAKVTPKGTHVRVEFQKVIQEYEGCVAWKSTNRFDHIDSSGNVYYVQLCTKTGPMKEDRTPEDVELDAALSEGLKPGMRLLADKEGAIVATAGPKSSKAVWLFGVSLK